MTARGVRIAVEGCGHGTLDAIYASVAESCRVKGWNAIDLLIIGGDFQAVRNAADLNCMAVPVKYREIGDFHKYYSGERVAPYPTVFVGGNHEASNHLWELYYGGWVAPNIYYLGAANVIRLGPLRIAGLSGIWKGYNYKKSHYERLAYNQDDVRSIYHVRELDVRKLQQVRTQIHIGISHDWPRGIEWMGDWKTLFRKKDQFESDARAGNLGSVAAKLVMEHLRPPYWFCAHLHIKYAAIVNHATSPPTVEPAVPTKPIKNAAEIDLEDDEEDVELDPGSTLVDTKETAKLDEKDKPSTTVAADIRAQLPASFSKPVIIETPKEPDPPTTISNTTTKFLALDKCLPKRDFLQLLEIEDPSPEASLTEDGPAARLTYDPEWLAITRAFAKAEPLQLGDINAEVPRDKGRAHYAPLIAAEEAWVDANVTQKGKLLVPENFELTAPVHVASDPVSTREWPREYNSPQTQAFCEMLEIENPFWASEEETTARMQSGPRPEERREGGFGGGRGGRGRGGGGFSGGRGRGGRGRGRGGRGRGGR